MQVGSNQLELTFRSPILRARPLQQAAGLIYPAENDKSDDKLSVFVRKAPCHFGWDWGPRFVSSGIWRPITLQCVPLGRIVDSHAQVVSLSDTEAQLLIGAEVELPDGAGTDLQLELSCELAEFAAKASPVTPQAGRQTLQFAVSIDNPQLWWPAGFGDAFLYPFELTLRAGATAATTSATTPAAQAIDVQVVAGWDPPD